ncbi:MAG: autoinducer binding domain-containing protein [Proteobacteria bacterium]|nr:autoinducer binding domain-containing protein [Pseudomonadota bacterium]
MFLQEAVEFLDRLTGIETERELRSELQRILRLWGIDYFCFASYPRPDSKLADVVLSQNVPKFWLDHYGDQNFLHVDAAIKFSRATLYPFKYVDAPDPERKAARLVQDMREAGFDNAVMVPVGGHTGLRGVVWLQGANFKMEAIAFLHIIILYAYERLAHLQMETTTRALSNREKEVLTWSAMGKSAWETGEILRISQRTVEEYLKSATRKLGAANRTHAVALALRDGLITP